MNINENCVNDCHRIGRGKAPRPILLSLNSFHMKLEIIKKRENFNKLKIALSSDRTREDREYRRKLYICLQKIKEIDRNAVIYNSFIKLNDKKYNLEEAETFIQQLCRNRTLEEDRMNATEDANPSKRKKSNIRDKLGTFRFSPSSGST